MIKANKKLWYKVLSIVLLLICIVCIVLLLIPFIAQLNSDEEVVRQIADYNSIVEKVTDERADEMLNEAKSYNKRLLNTGTIFGNIDEEKYNSLLRVSDGIMGYINIPSVNIHLCIYHGTDEKTIESGIGHVNTTSLPVGDETAHTILIGHRGVPTNRLFTDLDKVAINDTFTINILNKSFTYQVETIKTIQPYELDKLRFEDKRNLVSLVTCTPYGVNTHRLVVTGVLVDTDTAYLSKERTETLLHNETDVIHRNIPFEPALIVVAIFIVLFIVYFIVDTIKQKRGKHK